MHKDSNSVWLIWSNKSLISAISIIFYRQHSFIIFIIDIKGKQSKSNFNKLQLITFYNSRKRYKWLKITPTIHNMKAFTLIIKI